MVMKRKKNIKTFFKDKKLFDTALTHKSWINEHKGKRESNERMEFLGDAILEFIVTEKLYEKFPNKEEGYMTALRARFVNTESLAQVAKKLNLGDLIYLSKGEEEGGGRSNHSLLANTFEAIIGALYFDQGLNKVKAFLDNYLLADLDKVASEPLKDPKSRLQEIIQARGYPTPKYEVVAESGPDHAKEFTIEVVIDKKPWGKGKGKNKAEAAQNAAEKILTRIL